MRNFYFQTKSGIKVFAAENVQDAMAKANEKGFVVLRVLTEAEMAERSITGMRETRGEKVNKISI